MFRLSVRSDRPAPLIAIDYWRLPPDAKLIDVLYAVRSDETTHRFVNHSLANLDPSTDVNPFAFREPDMFSKGKKPGRVFVSFSSNTRRAYRSPGIDSRGPSQKSTLKNPENFLLKTLTEEHPDDGRHV